MSQEQEWGTAPRSPSQPFPRRRDGAGGLLHGEAGMQKGISPGGSGAFCHDILAAPAPPKGVQG